MIITIDGPTASGKTTVARLLAQKLNYYYLSSGLLFRGLAYVLIHDLLYTPDQLKNPRESDLRKALAALDYAYDAQDGEQLMVGGKNIVGSVRGQEISEAASIIGTNSAVREGLQELQHRIANNHDLVAEGRDMGSVIFPDAQVKFFLTAPEQTRASRWQKDQHHKGRKITHAQAVTEIRTRDERDTKRVLAPLCIAQGAIIIDDSNLNQQQVVDYMIAHIK